MKILPSSFFLSPTLEVARELLGKLLVVGKRAVVITETEAYFGFDDEASHAYGGKIGRNFPMYERGGTSYVYLIYGMYHCLNLVSEEKGFPAAVLIRGGIEHAAFLKGERGPALDGPGKLCRYLAIDKSFNNLKLGKNSGIFAANSGITFAHRRTPRIGISRGLELKWRFIAKTSLYSPPR